MHENLNAAQENGKSGDEQLEIPATFTASHDHHGFLNSTLHRKSPCRHLAGPSPRRRRCSSTPRESQSPDSGFRVSLAAHLHLHAGAPQLVVRFLRRRLAWRHAEAHERERDGGGLTSTVHMRHFIDPCLRAQAAIIVGRGAAESRVPQ